MRLLRVNGQVEFVTSREACSSRDLKQKSVSVKKFLRNGIDVFIRIEETEKNESECYT